MKTTRSSPTRTHVPKEFKRFTGSRKPGSKARFVTDSVAACTFTGARVPAESECFPPPQVIASVAAAETAKRRDESDLPYC
ncbi:hypothetical protein RE2895_13700 [Rhodococcus erythropolis]|nr:hypothetical protein RE2895_13700 [Rhodococcus erythropolis]GCB54994.1 hypothetical protein rerp_14020 [Rhodococcus erythropolis]